jgi:fumarate hydratase class II
MKVIVETSTLIFYLGEKNPGCQNSHCEFSDKKGQAQARGVLVFRVNRKRGASGAIPARPQPSVPAPGGPCAHRRLSDANGITIKPTAYLIGPDNVVRYPRPPAGRRSARGAGVSRRYDCLMAEPYRIERDTMGEVQVPSEALYGAVTQRAVENFPISRLRLPRAFLRALGLVKAAAARVNGQLGVLPPELARAIEAAAEEVAEGRHDAQFVVDVFQTGSGTSTNMNANEVIATLAGRALGGGVSVHPNDLVNRSQSSNDVIPAAMHVAASSLARQELLPAMAGLYEALREKADEFRDVIKIARTHLQDALPIRLGQEFDGYGRQVEAAMERVHAALDGIYELPLGGTAVGTGLNAPAGFGKAVIRILAQRAGLPFREPRNRFEAQAARDAVANLSGALRGYAIALTKIANDIRWLGSGPRCGLGELKVPAVQPGSSSMPGKVNPVIAESLLMVCAQVIGYDATIAWCCAAGNFELNTMMPVMAHDLLESIELLAAGSRNFAEKCVRGLEADRGRAASLVEQSLALATALVPALGYDRAAAIAKEAADTGRTVREVARERSGLPEEQLAELLDPARQTGEGYTAA